MNRTHTRWLVQFLCIVLFLPFFPVQQAVAATLSTTSTLVPLVKSVRVMTVGGSVAHGWNDPEHNGYLHRAFNALSTQYGVTYAVYDKTIVGANSTQLQETLYKGDYEKWLSWVRPNIVVLSWGLLNDCLPKTPMDQFDQTLTQEITEAVKAHAMVFVITPPVTNASFTQYLVQEKAYSDEELKVVHALHLPNVYAFDVYDQMKQFISTNGLNYKVFSADGWHPDSAGHQLAARFIVSDINQTFHFNPPAVYVSASVPRWSTQW